MRPDFGMHLVDYEGVTLECRYVAPGLTMQDLTRVFSEARAKSTPEDRLSANPSKWPDVRGVMAVTDALLDAIYGTEPVT